MGRWREGMTDGGRMKGVEGGGGGAREGEEWEEEAREELELALSLGRRGAGSSRAAERVWGSPPVPRDPDT